MIEDMLMGSRISFTIFVVLLHLDILWRIYTHQEIIRKSKR